MLNDPRLDILVKQIEILMILFARPVVQRQVMAVALAILLAWLLDSLITTWIYPRFAPIRWSRPEQKRSRLFSLLLVGKRLYFPLIGLGLIPLITSLFERWHFPSGLIQNSAIIFWIILLYRALLGSLELWIPPLRLQIFRRRVLLPIFILLPTAVFLNQFVDLRSVLGIHLFNLLGAPINLGSIGLAFLWLYAFYVLGWVAVEGLQKVILPRTQANTGVANSITTISRYVIIIAGILVIFGSLGLDLTSLALIGTGLTVGIGFGMQQVIANFISGILLLFEQSLRPGDLIEIDNQVGTVQQLNIRSTVIRTVDAEIIVPNETFLTSQLTTFTKSNMLGRVVVPIGVSYESDPHQVKKILLETAVKHELVLEDPPPTIFFDAFGDSTLDFRLVSWIVEPRMRFQVRSELHFMVWDVLREQGIELPFPQRDLNLRGGWPEFIGTMAARSGEIPTENDEDEMLLPEDPTTSVDEEKLEVDGDRDGQGEEI
jgi:potassium-dependent mechanosensitive channel